jgi:hypothetical protein
MKMRSGYSFEGIPLLRILRFLFLLFIVGLIVASYYLHTEGKLFEVIYHAFDKKVIPFIYVYWYELGVSILLFLFGFWCGRRSLWIKGK